MVKPRLSVGWPCLWPCLWLWPWPWLCGGHCPELDVWKPGAGRFRPDRNGKLLGRRHPCQVIFQRQCDVTCWFGKMLRGLEGRWRESCQPSFGADTWPGSRRGGRFVHSPQDLVIHLHRRGCRAVKFWYFWRVSVGPGFHACEFDCPKFSVNGVSIFSAMYCKPARQTTESIQIY